MTYVCTYTSRDYYGTKFVRENNWLEDKHDDKFIYEEREKERKSEKFGEKWFKKNY